MNCKEFDENISAAVDRLLKDAEGALFEHHAKECPTCRRAFQEEVQTKMILLNRVKMFPVPPAATASIQDHLAFEPSGAPSRHIDLWNILVDTLTPKLAVSVAMAAALIVVVVTVPSLHFWTSPLAAAAVTDVIGQSHQNYEAILGGGLKPQMVSDQPDFVKSFFAGKTDFPVLVPSMKKCTLVGGGLNEVGGMKFAHVVYERNSDMIYLCQMCFESAMKGEKLRLPADAMHELEQTGWYVRKLPDGDALVLWSHGPTLCAALAGMSTDDLMTCLASTPVETPAR